MQTALLGSKRDKKIPGQKAHKLTSQRIDKYVPSDTCNPISAAAEGTQETQTTGQTERPALEWGPVGHSFPPQAAMLPTCPWWHCCPMAFWCQPKQGGQLCHSSPLLQLDSACKHVHAGSERSQPSWAPTMNPEHLKWTYFYFTVVFRLCTQSTLWLKHGVNIANQVL